MIRVFGQITDASGKGVPGAMIELRALKSTAEVLYGSVLPYKCDTLGYYDFPLAIGAYDVYAQNDFCGDMDYLGTAVVTADTINGDLHHILVDGGINITPPMLESALEYMRRTELAATTAETNRVQTGKDVTATAQNKQVSETKAGEASVSAGEAKIARDSIVNDAADVRLKATQVAQNTATVASNTSAVQRNTEQVAQNTQTVTTKAQQVSDNTQAVAANTLAVSQNKQVSETKAREASVSADEAKIARDSIVNDAADVRAKAKQVADDAVSVANNTAAVQRNTEQVAQNTQTVGTKAQQVAENTNSVSANTLSVTQMRDEVVAKTSMAQGAADTASQKAVDAAASDASARDAATRAESAALAMTGAILDGGECDLSSGFYPQPLTVSGQKYSTVWYVKTGGYVGGITYDAGDKLQYTTANNGFYFRIDARDEVVSVNGEKGAVTLNAQKVGADPAGTASSLIEQHAAKAGAHQISGVSGLTEALAEKASFQQLSSAIADKATRTDVSNSIAAHKAESNAHAPQNVGADPAGTAASAVLNHEEKLDPHPQYLTSAEIGDLEDRVTDIESRVIKQVSEVLWEGRVGTTDVPLNLSSPIAAGDIVTVVHSDSANHVSASVSIPAIKMTAGQSICFPFGKGAGTYLEYVNSTTLKALSFTSGYGVAQIVRTRFVIG